MNKYIRKSDEPLQRLVRRYSEIDNLNVSQKKEHDMKNPILFKRHAEGPLMQHIRIKSQYKIVLFKNMNIKVNNNRDNRCYLGGETCIVIENIVKAMDDEIYIIGKKLDKIGSLYPALKHVEFCTIEKVGTGRKNLIAEHITNISCKLWRMSLKENIDVVVPISHTNVY